MEKKRKVPLRKCVVCQESAEKRDLFRIVRSPEGEVSLDPTGKKNGRGAYLSRKESCVKKAKDKNLLSRHLGVPVPDEVFDQMITELGERSHAAE
jgi:Predicted nucleic-acid-binding protein implicated in transcription termination